MCSPLPTHPPTPSNFKFPTRRTRRATRAPRANNAAPATHLTAARRAASLFARARAAPHALRCAPPPPPPPAPAPSTGELSLLLAAGCVSCRRQRERAVYCSDDTRLIWSFARVSSSGLSGAGRSAPLPPPLGPTRPSSCTWAVLGVHLSVWREGCARLGRGERRANTRARAGSSTSTAAGTRAPAQAARKCGATGARSRQEEKF